LKEERDISKLDRTHDTAARSRHKDGENKV
jgi:hypothetical protein